MGKSNKKSVQSSPENANNSQKNVKKKTAEKKSGNQASSSSKKEIASSKNWTILAIIIACIVGWMHGVHVSTMFEKDRHFSHLSSLERDLTFRTEMGLYYSYYKSIISADTLYQGIHEIVRDNITEYPSTINVLKRFNLYPELIIGVGYRWFDAFTKANNFRTKDCWQIKRGNLPPIESCEGIGDQHYFYISNIFLLNGLMMTFLFLYAWYLSGESIWAGIIAVAFYFFNHGEATRVMWTPPLRESFSFPFLILEMALVTWTVKTPKPCYYKHGVLVGLAAFCFMLPWQFAQFALLTQVTALFALYLLQYIGSYKMKLFIYAHLASLGFNFIFQFGNEMLLTSFFASSLVIMLAIVLCEDIIECRVTNLIARCVIKGSLWIAGTMILKKLIATGLSVADDAHIWDILRSKFTNYANFHTMLYTCAKEFDFIEMSTIFSLSQTLLIPSTTLAIFFSAYALLKHEYNAYMEGKSDGEDNASGDKSEEETDKAYRSKPNAEVLYNILQMFAFIIIAVLIMRLKLFMTPALCIVSSLLANRQLMPFSSNRYKQVTILVVILAVAAVKGSKNLYNQLDIMGEFENWPHEQLLEFINGGLPKDAVFAGAMPTMASIKLSCNRAIVNHPHYEDAGLRERTRQVYKMYSRTSLSDVHEILTDMKVTHFILEDSWCTRRPKENCLMAEIYDIEYPELKGRTPACTHARNNPEPYFSVKFKNDVYTVLEVNKLNSSGARQRKS